ncbi:MAG: DUF1499 domain-containing protein, partial [Cetobacterium sp.]
MKKNLIILFTLCFSIIIAKENDDFMLKECPKSPNCVSSGSKDAKHYIEPIAIHNPVNIKKKLIYVIEQLGGAILIDKENYLKASFKSKFFGFEDIADFEIIEDEKIINVKSAAETGWYDFGVNRKRIEKIKI